ncbi:MAG TPA: glycosyltransferase [Terracidiphilus sp.]|nr:glycosyltransferase [Terracidiphilus sp.]
MRILYLSRAYTPHDHRFLSALASGPHQILFLRLHAQPAHYENRPIPPSIRELPPLASTNVLTSPAEWVPLAPRLKTILASEQPHLVHAGDIQTGAFLAALAGFHPLLAMSWGSDLLVDAHRDPLWSWITRFTLHRADMLLTDATEVTRAAVELAGLDPQRILQFPWGVDTALFHPGPDTLQLRNHPGWQNAVLVLSNRSWEPQYGVLHLLRAFALARESNPRLRLVLLGSGSQKEEIEQFLREHALAPHVLILGATPPRQLPEILRAVDLFASCAFSDGSSVSLLEAMATGLPVLATQRTSNQEWIASPDNGLLAPFGDIPAIAAALLTLASLTSGQRECIAAANRAAILDRANWDTSVTRLFAAYSTLRPDLD